MECILSFLGCSLAYERMLRPFPIEIIFSLKAKLLVVSFSGKCCASKVGENVNYKHFLKETSSWIKQRRRDAFCLISTRSPRWRSLRGDRTSFPPSQLIKLSFGKSNSPCWSVLHSMNWPGWQPIYSYIKDTWSHICPGTTFLSTIHWKLT